jgi:hypothetical protein
MANIPKFLLTGAGMNCPLVFFRIAIFAQMIGQCYFDIILMLFNAEILAKCLEKYVHDTADPDQTSRTHACTRPLVVLMALLIP